jgi:hypothetical protein
VTTPAAELPAPQPAEPATPATVHVRISAEPADAALTLDNTAIPNPFEADVPKSHKHRVQAHAPGHRSADVTVELDRDREVALKLEPIVAAPPAERAPKAKRGAVSKIAPAKPSTSVAINKPAHPAVAPATAPRTPAPSSTRGAGFVSESPY